MPGPIRLRLLPSRRAGDSSTSLASSVLAFALALVIAAGGACAQSAGGSDTGGSAAREPQWKSSPYHGVTDGNGRVIPCRCLFHGKAYQLGARVCMAQTVMECDLHQNNTTWVPTQQSCSSTS